MLEELHVSALGVVDDATLDLAPGLNVLTGETGAGKTMITVGLALTLGSRAASGMVRTGRRALSVEARFRVSSPGPELEAVLGRDDALDDAPEGARDGESGDGPVEPPENGQELVLSRTVGSEGKSSARIDGRLAPVANLAAVGDRLVEIHGQNQAARLLSPAAQLSFLDRFAGEDHEVVAATYREAFAELRRTLAALEALDRAARDREREKDLLRYQIREIEGAAVSPGELRALAEEGSRLAHAERILALAAEAERALGEDAGAADRLRQAAAAAQGIAALDAPAGGLFERFHSAAAEAADLLVEVRVYRESMEVDPARLAAVQERLQALKALERKYGDGEEGILAYLGEAGERLASLEGEDTERAALQERAALLEDRVAALADDLGSRRAHAAPRLAKALQAEVRALGMPGAEIAVELAALEELGSSGAERVEFVFAGGPGQPRMALAKAASGGELSRVMLACRSVLSDLDDVPTIVFDEVDAGIGGRTAAAVAERLAQVARRRQILVVTHLAQIAARADRHFLVTKEGGSATVRMLDGEERVEELARMLSGRTAGASLAHARELIEAGPSAR
ncbi:MAG TPA: DNA repair protein RecN [Actinomycetota bacterium]